MADPVQQAGGGEQVPPAVVDTAPTAIPEATATPEQKPPTAELPLEVPVKAEPPQAVPPKSQAPKTEPPKEEPPKEEPPKAEPPKAEPPKTDLSKAEPPKPEAPKLDLPKAEPPKADPPKADLPNTEPPKVESPKVDLPKAEPPKGEPLLSQPPTAESLNKEQVKNGETVDEAKINTTESIEVLASPITNEVELAAQESKDINDQGTKDIKDEVALPAAKQNVELEQTKETENNVDQVVSAPASEISEQDEKSPITPKESEGWQKRESELLKKIEELEKVKSARSEDSLRLELKIREEEIDLLKARVRNLETELQAALSKPGGKNHEIIESIKQQHEELLSKARGMIFDKTKMVKNQELQIEALTTQVQSLKDINVITKDLLEIRNSEVKAMEERFQAMEARFKAEKERYDLVLKRAQTSTNINDDLRKEYETQLAIFKELREKYELRVQALVAENNRLKEAVKGPGTSG